MKHRLKHLALAALSSLILHPSSFAAELTTILEGGSFSVAPTGTWDFSGSTFTAPGTYTLDTEWNTPAKVETIWAENFLFESEIDTDLKTFALPASTTISAFGASLVDDASNSAARGTLGLGTAATADLGGGLNQILVVTDSGITTDEYLSFNGTNGIDGNSPAEVRTDLSLDTLAAAESTWSVDLLDSTEAAAAYEPLGVDAADITDSTATGQAAITAADPAALRTLLNVEDGADVTDTANVTAAGALMDSEVTNLAAVKAFDPTAYEPAGITVADIPAQTTISDTDTQIPTSGAVVDYFFEALDSGGISFEKALYNSGTGIASTLEQSATTDQGLNSLTIRIPLSLYDWTPGEEATIIDKTASNLGVRLVVEPDGTLSYRIGNGVDIATLKYDSTDQLPYADWSGADLVIFDDVENGQIHFYSNGSRLGEPVPAISAQSQYRTSTADWDILDGVEGLFADSFVLKSGPITSAEVANRFIAPELWNQIPDGELDGLITGDDRNGDSDTGTWNDATIGGGLIAAYDSGDVGFDSVFRIQATDSSNDRIETNLNLVESVVYRVQFDIKSISAAESHWIAFTNTDRSTITRMQTSFLDSHDLGDGWVRYSGSVIASSTGIGTLRLYVNGGSGGAATDEMLLDNITVYTPGLAGSLAATGVTQLSPLSESPSVTNPTDAPADADALRDDLTNNVIPSIELMVGQNAERINDLMEALEDLNLINQ